MRVLVLALALLAAAAPGAGALADTKSELTEARARLSALEARIAAGQAAAADLLKRSVEVASRLAVQRQAYAETEAELAQVRQDMAQARAALESLRRQLDSRAAAAYVGGPGSALEVLLSSSTMADFSARLEFVNQVASSDADLLLEIGRREDALGRKAEEVAALRTTQGRILVTLQAQDRTVRGLFAEQERLLARLAADRQEAAALVQKLGKQLRAEELAAARAAAFGGGSITFGQWAGYFLPRVGAPACHDNMVAVVAWGVAEYTSARWNPLATSYPMPGATNFTSGGVKSYRSLDQGLDATELTLERGSASLGYGPILQSLRGCAGAMDTARAIDASSWCGCGAYVEARISAVQAYYDHYANMKSPAS